MRRDLGLCRPTHGHRDSEGMDIEPRPAAPIETSDDERTVDDDRLDEIPVPLDPPFEVPVVDALEQSTTVLLDDDGDGERSV